MPSCCNCLAQARRGLLLLCRRCGSSPLRLPIGSLLQDRSEPLAAAVAEDNGHGIPASAQDPVSLMLSTAAEPGLEHWAMAELAQLPFRIELFFRPCASDTVARTLFCRRVLSSARVLDRTLTLSCTALARKHSPFDYTKTQRHLEPATRERAPSTSTQWHTMARVLGRRPYGSLRGSSKRPHQDLVCLPNLKEFDPRRH